MSFDPFGVVKNASIAYSSIGASYSDALTGCQGRYIEVKNGTNQNLIIKAIGLNSSVIEKCLLAGDLMPRIIPCTHSGVIQVKYQSSAPTSGSLDIESFSDGV